MDCSPLSFKASGSTDSSQSLSGKLLLVPLTISLSTMFRAPPAELLPLSLQPLQMHSEVVAVLVQEEISLRTLFGLMSRKLPRFKSASLKTVTKTALRKDRSGRLSFGSTESSSYSLLSICAAFASDPEWPSAESVLVFAPPASL